MAVIGPKLPGERRSRHPAIERMEMIRRRDAHAARAKEALDAAESELSAAERGLFAAERALEEHEYTRLRTAVRKARAVRDRAAEHRDAASRLHGEAARAANMTEWDRRAVERAERKARRDL